MKRRNTTIIVGLHQKLTGLLLLLLFSSGLVSAQSAVKPKEYHGAEAARLVPGATYVKVRANTPYPSFVRLEGSQQLTEAEFVPWLKQTLKTGAEVDFNLVKKERDEIDMIHIRYSQTFKGIPVDQSTYIGHFKANALSYFNGQAYELSSELSPKPALSEKDALDAVKKAAGADRYKWEDAYWEGNIKERNKDQNATYFPKADLVWYSVEIHHSVTRPSFKLAYRFDIYAASPDFAKRIYIDANTGTVLNTVPLESNCEPSVNFTSIFNGTQSVRTDKFQTGPDNFRLRDDCQGSVMYIRDWNSATDGGGAPPPSPLDITSGDNTWTTTNQRFGATVLWETKQSYSYFLSVHGRNSYDGSGGNVQGYINARFNSSGGGTNPDNASMSFTGGNMKVGLGSSGTLANSWSSLDIIAHEYTHAVTGSSSALVYAGESGALNESFSDIFGDAIENWVTGTNDWLVGDDRTSGRIRSIDSPKRDSDPDTYLGTFWTTIGGTCDNTNDFCGVHRNSGVQNKWFYLLTVGENGTNDNNDAYSVSGIGLSSARRIAFRNLTLKLTANSDYSDARDGAIQSAIDLFGICSDEVKQTTNAWYAVGVGDPYFNATASVTSNYNGRDISCTGACDGAVTVVAANGNEPYDYLWSANAGNATTASVSNLCAGVYTVTVTDDDNCTTSASVTLTDPPQLSTTASATSDYNGYNVSCNGGSDGEAEAFPTGGTPPYTYSWNDGSAQTTKEATGLSATTYTVTVTDANGCTASSNVTLTEPTPLTIDAGANQVVYYGFPDSSCADLSATGVGGGVTNVGYTHTWSTGSNDADINVCPIASTTYYVTVTDANGCTATDSVRVCVIDVRCGHKLDKVTICHRNSGSSNPLTICITIADAQNHFIAHAGFDQLAACGIDKTCDFPPAAKQFVANPVGAYLDAIPNPFTSSTTIRFSLPESSRAYLTVYDLTGREITALYDDETISGNSYEVAFDGSKYPSGIYMLVLKSGSGEQLVRKIVLTK